MDGPTKEKSRQLRSKTVLELMEMLRLEDENAADNEDSEEEDEADPADERFLLEMMIRELRGNSVIIVDGDEDVSRKRQRRLRAANPVEAPVAAEVAAVAVAKDLPEVGVAEDLQDLGRNMEINSEASAPAVRNAEIEGDASAPKGKAKSKAAAKAKGKSKAWHVLHKDSDLPELSDEEIDALYETRPHGCCKCKGKVGCTPSCKDNNTVPFRVPR